MKRMGVLSIACAAALTIACNGNARTDNRTEPAAVGTTGDTDRTTVQDSDKDFVNKMLSDGMAEVELGKLASERAANPDVKRFAQMMVQDHTKAGDELKAIATSHNIPGPSGVDDQHRDVMDKLSKIRGSQFDREYIDAMVDGHQKVVDDLESRVDSTAPLKDRVVNDDKAKAQITPEQTNNAPKAAVNEWAAKSLPTVRHHLDEAKRLDDQLDRTRTSTRNETAPVKPRK